MTKLFFPQIKSNPTSMSTNHQKSPEKTRSRFSALLTTLHSPRKWEVFQSNCSILSKTRRRFWTRNLAARDSKQTIDAIISIQNTRIWLQAIPTSRLSSMMPRTKQNWSDLSMTMSLSRKLSITEAIKWPTGSPTLTNKDLLLWRAKVENIWISE